MEQPLIHPTAVIDPAAELDSSVEVGPYAVSGPRVRIGAGCKVGAHVVLEGPTTLGENNRLYPFCSVGAAPQDKKYAGEDTALEIGNGNTIRECVTINRGTVQDGGTTRVGDDNWIMAYVHIAHDCVVGNHTIFANTTNLAGHVHIGDWVILGGNSQVHQFCKIGAHAMTGTGSIVLQDIPPYVMASGNPLATAAGNAVLDVMEEEKLPERAQKLGDQLRARLESLRAKVPQIVDVRGLGLMIAVEFNKPGTSEPNPEYANAVRLAALERGLILLTCGVYGNAIRFLPPLTIEQKTFDEALDILEAVMVEQASKVG